MNLIEKKIQELKTLKNKLPSEAKKIIFENKEYILDLIREKQLFELGVDGKGRKLKSYTPFTIAVKKNNNQPTNRTTLNDTGAFYEGFNLLTTDQLSIGIFSTDVKTPDLVEKYGSDIFIFTVDNNKKANELILNELYKWLLNTPTFTRL